MAGDYRAHSGAPSKVFDNARHDLATAFAKLGFKRANMLQFSVDYDDGTEHVAIPDIAAGAADPDQPRQGRLPDLFHLPWHARPA